MELIVFFLAVGLLIAGISISTASKRLDTKDQQVRQLEAYCNKLHGRLTDLESSDEDDDEEAEEPTPAFSPTHCINNNGREVFVRKSRPGYGVDMSGKQWPLFIKPGQADYSIKRV